MNSRYIIAPDADKDLDEIRDKIASDSPAAAERLLRLFHTHFERIADFPHIGTAREDIRPSLRSVPVGNYVIFYREAPEAVQIVRVLWGGRDIKRLLKD